MSRSFGFAFALASAAALLLLPASAEVVDRNLPMHFKMRVQGPAASCGDHCRLWISASGAITADTPHDFEIFAKGRNLAGATVVVESDGGSVLGAIALGREIRRRGLDTTVGRLIDVPSGQETPRARYIPRADCESMCGFVVLGGVHRSVPPEARVMVHQIWLGDRREDPTAASYSAEDIVLVQHDIGKLAEYTIEMGGSIELLNLALRIPPWEPMHALTADETRRSRLVTDDLLPAAAETVAASPPATKMTPKLPVSNVASATKISERRWAVVNQSGTASLARHHPLTVEGDDVGSFDLLVACGSASGRYDVTYLERRYDGDRIALPADAGTVAVTAGGISAALKVVSSERRSDPNERITYASGTVPAALIDHFAAAGNHSMLIETRSPGSVTGIRLGNTGAQANLPRLAASCVKPIGNRAELPQPKTGGLASAQ